MDDASYTKFVLLAFEHQGAVAISDHQLVDDLLGFIVKCSKIKPNSESFATDQNAVNGDGMQV